MNCELLGNGDTHSHWHLFLRISGDIENFGIMGKGRFGAILWRKCIMMITALQI